MRMVLLTDICSPKQWKTISKKNLKTKGYPVYGANGIIGYYNEYTHENPTILIGCRGTCGNVNVSVPQSYVNGNAMALDNLSPSVDLSFLSHYLIHRGFNDVISGSSQPQITRQNLKKVTIPLLPLEEQKKLAAILDAADDFRQKTKALIGKYDQLKQSLFIYIFGDPVTNPKNWDLDILNNVCSKITDGTHDTPSRLDNGVKFITGKHIRPYVIDYENSDYVDKEIHDIIYRRCNPEFGDVLYTNIGANLGTAAINSVEYEFSMKNVALLKPVNELITGKYIEFFLNSDNMKEKVLWIGSQGGAQQFLSLTQLRKLIINLPPKSLQNQFTERVAQIDKQKQQAEASLVKAEELFSSLLQRAFKGELTS